MKKIAKSESDLGFFEGYRQTPTSLMLPLEPRIMFDAAAVDTISHVADNHDADDGHDDGSHDDLPDDVTPVMSDSPDVLKKELLTKTPIHFEENVGQFDGDVNYVSRGSNYTLYVTNDEIVLSLLNAETGKYSTLRMDWVGGNESATIKAVNELAAKTNYMFGEKSDWITGVSNYEKVVYENAYDGIDMVLYGSNEGRLEYDFVVDAGKDYSQIGLNFDGAKSLEVDANGNLVINMEGGTLTQKAPVAYQTIDGKQVEVDVSFDIKENGQVGFKVGDYDNTKELRIDPVLHYSTFIGSSNPDTWQGGDIAVDNDGNTYVTGSVNGADFPTKGGVSFGSQIGGADAFVTKYDANGLIVYSTYMGGTGNDYGNAITVDDTGRVVMGGTTYSSDIPTFAGNPNESRFGDGTYSEGFVVKLDATGTADYGTYIGGNNGDTAINDIAIDASGNFYVTGSTAATKAGGFNITDGTGDTAAAAYDTQSGGNDAFVMRFNSSGDVTYGSYLGGSGEDIGYGVGVDGSGNFFVAGQTGSALFPTLNQTQVDQGGSDLFVTKFNANGTMAYSTYLGGGDEDVGHSSMLAVDGSGNAYVVGTSASTDYYRLNAYKTDLEGVTDGVITKIDTDGTVIYSTYYGGGGDDGLYAAAVDGAGNLYAAGYTDGAYPILNETQSSNAGGTDGVIVKLDSDGNPLYSTYFGGSGTDKIHSIDVDGNQNIYLFGETASDDFPVESAEQGAINGSPDYFVSSISKNTAPTLNDPGDLTLSGVDEDVASDANNGDAVADIINAGANVVDPDASDVHGIAITSLSGSENGTWQYSTDSGVTWQDVGAVDESSALLLGGELTTRLRFQPNAAWNGSATITFRAWDQSEGTSGTKVDTAVNGRGTSFSEATAVATVLVASVADPPSVTNSTTGEDTMSTSGLIITPNSEDGGSVTHYQITNITNGKLYLADGTTQVTEGSFITVSDGAAGLKWLPDENVIVDGSFKVYSSTDGVNASSSAATATITVNPLADTPTVPSISAKEDTMTSASLIITKNAVDGAEVTHFKITNVANGTLYLADGVTVVNSGSFITEAQASAGLRWMPQDNSVADGSFDVQASVSADDTGLGGDVVTSTITVAAVPDNPTVTNAETDEDVMSDSGLVITRNPSDGEEVQYYQITNIQNGTLYLSDGVTQINDGDYISIGEGLGGLRFLGDENSYADGSFDVQAATANDGTGNKSVAMTAVITVNAVADAPTITNATTSEDTMSKGGLVVSRNEADGEEVTHFKIKTITNGHLYLADGTTELFEGDFINIEQGLAGLRFTGMENSFEDGVVTVQGSLSADDSGIGEDSSATVTIDPVADTPTYKGGDASGVVQTKPGGLIVLRNPVDGDEVTHFQITNIKNGTLYYADGTTVVEDGTFITAEQGLQGLRFTPSPRDSDCSFLVQGSISGEAWGLGDDPAKVVINAPIFPNATELQNQGNASMHETVDAQNRQNNVDRLQNEARRIEKVSFSEPFAKQTAEDNTYLPERNTSLFMIRQAANPNMLAPASDFDGRILTDALFEARMNGVTDAVSSSFMSLVDGSAYKNPDNNANLYEGMAPINDATPLTKENIEKLPVLEIPEQFVENNAASQSDFANDDGEEFEAMKTALVDDYLQIKKNSFDGEVEKIISSLGKRS
jgi:hypothetical protein